MAMKHERPNPGYRVGHEPRKDGGGKRMNKRKVFYQYPWDTNERGMIKRGVKPADGLWNGLPVRRSNSKWAPGYHPRSNT